MQHVPSAEGWREIARSLVPAFAARAVTWDRERRYPWRNVLELADAGLMGMTIPRQHGGAGASFLDVVHAVEEIAGACTLTARIVVEGNMGAVSAVMAYGTPEQRERVAPLVRGGDKPAICITEPEAGSDAGSMRTTARRVAGGYLLSGTKHWITGGGVSKVHLVFARVEHEGEDEGIGGFLVIVEGEPPEGFAVAGRERTMGLCGMPEAVLHFRDLFVPDAMVVTPPGGFRRGFARLMTAYNSQRVGAGTIAMGTAAGALAHAVRYLREREQFGRPLAEFQGLQWMVADMDAGLHASRLLLHEAARSRCAAGFPEVATAARAKLFASETAVRVVDQSLQMFGARGYGADEPLERMYRDVRMFTIGGGTAQVLRTQLASHVLGMKLPQTRPVA